MLYWAIVFFVLALVAGIFGFTDLASGLAGISKILFFIFAVLLVLIIVSRLMRGESPTP